MFRTLALTAALVAVAFTSLTACKTGEVRETLDEQTYVSVITAKPPMTFFRLSTDGTFERELLSVGVLERIASTERDIYLWLNLWGTRTDGSTGDVPLGDTVTFHTADGPFTVTRSADDHRALGLSKAPFSVMRSGVGQGYFRADIDEIALLSADSSVFVEVSDQRYEPWGNQERGRDAISRYLEEARF